MIRTNKKLGMRIRIINHKDKQIKIFIKKS
jgi:hypothetical protein